MKFLKPLKSYLLLVLVFSLSVLFSCMPHKEEAPPVPEGNPDIEMLKQARAWASDLKPRVDKRGAAMAESKAIAAAGAADARAVMNGIEAYQKSLEQAANADMEQFRRWTDRNNALARRWIKSDSPKHRKWAEAWLKKRTAS